jgi:hypothetical protein
MRRFLFLMTMGCLGLYSCGDSRPEVALDIQIEELSDGFSTFYRFTPRGEILPQEGEHRWYFGSRLVGMDPELHFAFSPSELQGIQSISLKILSEDFRFVSAPILVDQEMGTYALPGAKKYLTIPAPGDPFLLVGDLVQKLGPTDSLEDLETLNAYSGWTLYRAKRPGFYNLITVEELEDQEALTLERNSEEMLTKEHAYNVFVSPVDSVHLDRHDRDWYYTQFRTSTTSNCGPTVVSMALEWAKGYELPVSEVRRMIGWRGAGGVTLEEMSEVLDHHEVGNQVVTVESVQDIFSILESGNLVGLVYDMAGLEEVEDPLNNLLGQYYTDWGGHYLAVKGYSVDREYFIIYDPIPADWTENDQRYHDQESMWGRNRYYPAEELFEALRRNSVIEIFSESSPG